MTDQIALAAALRRLHCTHRLLTREEADKLAVLLGIPASQSGDAGVLGV